MSDILKEFIKNDIVSIKQVNCKDNAETPLFTISQLENDKVYLLGVESPYKIEDISPVTITDHTIKNIGCYTTYMASVLDADQTDQLLSKSQRLDIRINDEDVSDLIKKYSIKYVHDLQHILQEKQTCIHLKLTCTYSHIDQLTQN